ncbi:MAG: hypothetical protein BRD55_09845 [Bacteroidetes bacterium SW_9_63_38]|nr:MAG: hypothetical protein BRD55_09845 [Bacteroidetes bacterium SW_9_63_38]
MSSWVEPDTIVSGEPFTLNVTASTPAHREVWFPEADPDSAVFGDLTVLRRSEVFSRPVGVMYALDSVAYTVKVSARDSVRVPPIPVKVDAAADTVETQTPPFMVPIVSRGLPQALSEADLGSEPLGAVGWGMLGMIVVVGLGSGVYVWRRIVISSKTDSELPVSGGSDSAPTVYEATRQELEALNPQDLTKIGGVESLYVTLTGTLRTYLSRRFDIPARERTTPELLAVLRDHDHVPSSATDRLRNVLEEADLVKFAGRRPDASVARNHIREALTALDVIEHGAEEGTARVRS